MNIRVAPELLATPILLFCALASGAQDQPFKVTVRWDKVIRTSQTTPTLQVVVNPPLQRGTAVHDNAFNALHVLGADYVRYVPWLPYPKLGVVGLALAMTTDPHYFEYFVEHKNRKPGIPLDFISYHFYAIPTPDQTPQVEQFTYFDQADGFLTAVRYVEAIRKRLSLETKTTIDELGVISADDIAQVIPGHVAQPIPNSYWNLAGAMYAYIFGELTQIGIDVAGESQLVGFPTKFPSVSMVDWNNGKPNARFWVLKLLHDNFGPGGKRVEIEPFSEFMPSSPYVYAGFRLA